MAAVDAASIFEPGANLNQSQSTVDSTNTIDLGQGKDAFGNYLANPDIGMGKPVFVDILITTTATGTTGATAQFFLYDAADSGGTGSSYAGTAGAFTGGNNPIGATGIIPLASLTAGAHFFIAVPPYAREYLKITESSAGGQNFTGGKWAAWLSGEPVSTV